MSSVNNRTPVVLNFDDSAHGKKSFALVVN